MNSLQEVRCRRSLLYEIPMLAGYIREMGIPQRFSTVKIGRNVKDRKNGVVSLVTSHYFCNLHRYVVPLNVINIWRSKAVSTTHSPPTSILHNNPTKPHLHPTPIPYTSPNMSFSTHVFSLMYYSQRHRPSGHVQQRGGRAAEHQGAG